MSKSVRTVFDEENFIELLFTGDTTSDGIKFVLNGKPGWNKVGVSNSDLESIITGGEAISYGYFNLDVRYILQDIGYDRINSWLTKYKNERN